MLGNRRVNRMRAAASIVGVIAFVAGCGGDAPGDNSEGVARQVRGTAGTTDRAVRSAQRCDAPDASVIIDSVGIGPILRGTRISAASSRCTVKDTTLVMSEGMSERAHLIPIGERMLTVLTTGTSDTSIIRVITQDRRFRTVGGVGVGSSVQALRLAHGSICAARAEGEFVVMAANLPGVSFAIDWNPPPSREPSAAETPFPGGDPGTALDDARITKAWVHGVSGACRVGVG